MFLSDLKELISELLSIEGQLRAKHDLINVVKRYALLRVRGRRAYLNLIGGRLL